MKARELISRLESVHPDSVIKFNKIARHKKIEGSLLLIDPTTDEKILIFIHKEKDKKKNGAA
jgi:hypothetical protein